MPEENQTTSVLLTVVYDSGMDERLTEIADGLGVEGWTKQFGAHGCGGTGRKLDSPIFPGTVNVMTFLTEADRVPEMTAAFRALQRSYRRKPGLTMWAQPVTRY